LLLSPFPTRRSSELSRRHVVRRTRRCRALLPAAGRRASCEQDTSPSLPRQRAHLHAYSHLLAAGALPPADDAPARYRCTWAHNCARSSQVHPSTQQTNRRRARLARAAGGSPNPDLACPGPERGEGARGVALTACLRLPEQVGVEAHGQTFGVLAIGI